MLDKLTPESAILQAEGPDYAVKDANLIKLVTANCHSGDAIVDLIKGHIATSLLRDSPDGRNLSILFAAEYASHQKKQDISLIQIKSDNTTHDIIFIGEPIAPTNLIVHTGDPVPTERTQYTLRQFLDNNQNGVIVDAYFKCCGNSKKELAELLEEYGNCPIEEILKFHQIPNFTTNAPAIIRSASQLAGAIKSSGIQLNLTRALKDNPDQSKVEDIKTSSPKEKKTSSSPIVDDYPAEEEKARALYNARKYDEATQKFNQLLKDARTNSNYSSKELLPRCGRLYDWLACCSDAQKKYSLSVQYYQRALAIYRYTSRQHFRAALTYYCKALANSKANPLQYITKACQMYETQKYNWSIAYYSLKYAIQCSSIGSVEQYLPMIADYAREEGDDEELIKALAQQLESMKKSQDEQKIAALAKTTEGPKLLIKEKKQTEELSEKLKIKEKQIRELQIELQEKEKEVKGSATQNKELQIQLQQKMKEVGSSQQQREKLATEVQQLKSEMKPQSEIIKRLTTEKQNALTEANSIRIKESENSTVIQQQVKHINNLQKQLEESRKELALAEKEKQLQAEEIVQLKKDTQKKDKEHKEKTEAMSQQFNESISAIKQQVGKQSRQLASEIQLKNALADEVAQLRQELQNQKAEKESLEKDWQERVRTYNTPQAKYERRVREEAYKSIEQELKEKKATVPTTLRDKSNNNRLMLYPRRIMGAPSNAYDLDALEARFYTPLPSEASEQKATKYVNTDFVTKKPIPRELLIFEPDNNLEQMRDKFLTTKTGMPLEEWEKVVRTELEAESNMVLQSASGHTLFNRHLALAPGNKSHPKVGFQPAFRTVSK